MCVLLFSPGRTLHIDYAAESITISNGGREDVIDLLVTNHSPEAIDRIHCIYPHAISLGGDDTGSVSDITSTLLSDSSHYNDLYSPEHTKREVERSADKDLLKIKMVNPSDVTQTVDYIGSIRGPQELVPYSATDKDVLTGREWLILQHLGWSAFTLTFQFPILQDEARWLRLRAVTGILPSNKMSSSERWLRRHLGMLTDRFEIAGPLDVRYRLLNVIKAAGAYGTGGVPSADQRKPNNAEAESRMLLHSLDSKLVVKGMLAPNTTTVIKDWRLNVFMRRYRRFDQPTWSGAIIPCGPLINWLKSARTGQEEQCCQWKAGENHFEKEVKIDSSGNVINLPPKGFFAVRIQAHEESLIRVFLPWLALTLGVVNLLWRILDSFLKN